MAEAKGKSKTARTSTKASLESIAIYRANLVFKAFTKAPEKRLKTGKGNKLNR